MFHKPKGTIVTLSDEKSRKTVYDILPRFVLEDRWIPVGRLDRDSLRRGRGDDHIRAHDPSPHVEVGSNAEGGPKARLAVPIFHLSRLFH